MPSFSYSARVSSSSRFVWLSLVRQHFLINVDSQALFEGFFVDECRVDVFDVSGGTEACSQRNEMLNSDRKGHPYQLLP